VSSPGADRAAATVAVTETSPAGAVDEHDPSRSARRRALTIAAVPAVVVAVVVGVVVALAASVVVGVVAGAVAGLAWWIVTLLGGRRVLLRALGAHEPDEGTIARAENLVDGLCATMGLVAPEMLVVDDPSCNAMAVGWRPGDAALVVTSGLLSSLGPVSLEGVLAHELAHIKRGDIAPATVAAAVLLPLAAVTPAAAVVVHRWAGIGREFRADAVAVGVTRFPPGLRDALATMVEGPVPVAPSPLADSAVARATRWLWAVALPSPETVGADVPEVDLLTGQLDAPVVRIAALDEC
jgi:Zn-dependent protease with chaperone function